MNNSILSLQKHQVIDIKQPVYYAVKQTPPECISINFCPRVKFLHATWTQNICSDDLRHAVRLLARATALLRAELVLIDLPAMLYVSQEASRWVSSFLREALGKLPIRRVARVLPRDNSSSEVLQKVLSTMGQLPYEAKVFTDVEQAKEWLLGNLLNQVSADETIRVPLNLNLKRIRTSLSRHGQAKVQAAPAQGGQHTSLSEILPDKLRVRTEFVSIAIDQRRSFMNMHWMKVPHSRQYRYGMLKAIRAVTEHSLRLLLLNNQRLGVLTLEDQGWLISTAQRMLPNTCLKKLAIVTSADVLQQISSEAIGVKLRLAELPLETRCFLSEEDAREWLQSEV